MSPSLRPRKRDLHREPSDRLEEAMKSAGAVTLSGALPASTVAIVVGQHGVDLRMGMIAPEGLPSVVALLRSAADRLERQLQEPR